MGVKVGGCNGKTVRCSLKSFEQCISRSTYFQIILSFSTWLVLKYVAKLMNFSCQIRFNAKNDLESGFCKENGGKYNNF